MLRNVSQLGIKKIEKFINSWNEETTVDNILFDKQFHIESIPLWWFYRRLIVRHVLPKQLNTYSSLYQDKPLTITEEWKYTFVSKFLPFYFLQRERHKISWIQKHSVFQPEKIQKDSLNKDKDDLKKKVLFLTYSNHLSPENTLFRLENVITELKSRVLKLLGYPSELIKKTNLLYRYTIYTPQEQMKQIIIEDPETRLNILRYIFGIDKYKTIRENLQILMNKNF